MLSAEFQQILERNNLAHTFELDGTSGKVVTPHLTVVFADYNTPQEAYSCLILAGASEPCNLCTSNSTLVVNYGNILHLTFSAGTLSVQETLTLNVLP